MRGSLLAEVNSHGQHRGRGHAVDPPVGLTAEAPSTGVSAKMIRHYEAIGLIPPASRTFANYRLYNEADVHRLRFIKRARNLGFSMKQIEQLLGLWSDPGRSSAEVKQLALAHAHDLSQRIAEMQSMQRTLERLAKHCHGDNRPDCPILDDLAHP